MDLNDLRVQTDAKEIRLTHPVTGDMLGTDDKPCAIIVVPPEHPRMKAMERKLTDKRVRAAQMARGRLKLEASEMEAENVERLVTCIEGWKNLEIGGKPLPVTPENARMLMTEPGFSWIREQVDAAAGDVGNFLTKTASPSSKPLSDTKPG